MWILLEFSVATFERVVQEAMKLYGMAVTYVVHESLTQSKVKNCVFCLVSLFSNDQSEGYSSIFSCEHSSTKCRAWVMSHLNVVRETSQRDTDSFIIYD